MNVNKNLLLGIAIGLTVAFLVSSLNVLHQFDPKTQVAQLSIPETDTSSKASDPKVGVSNLNQRTPMTDDVRAAMTSGNDERFHSDDDNEAQALAKKVRVLIWVMTAPWNLPVKAATVRDTWGKRVDKLLFFSSETNKTFPTIGLNVSEGRQHLTAKTMQGFQYVYDHHFDDADWFMKADDDTFVIIENLRYFLSNENSSAPVYFGHHFKTIVKQGYYSGGGGYVLSKEALRRFATKREEMNCRKDGGPEDATLGKCMELLGVKTANSTDALGRSRFHCFNPETHIAGEYPKWYYHYDSHGAPRGPDTISDYAVSFHYVPPKMMRNLNFYIYHLRPYGVKSGGQDLNVRH